MSIFDYSKPIVRLVWASMFCIGSFITGYGYRGAVDSPAPCEIVTDRALRPGMVIECPTGERVNCDTTFYYRLP